LHIGLARKEEPVDLASIVEFALSVVLLLIVVPVLYVLLQDGRSQRTRPRDFKPLMAALSGVALVALGIGTLSAIRALLAQGLLPAFLGPALQSWGDLFFGVAVVVGLLSLLMALAFYLTADDESRP